MPAENESRSIRDPKTPKDWLQPGLRFGVAVDRDVVGSGFLTVEDMDGHATGSEADRKLWPALRRAARLQHLLVVEIRARMPRHGYRSYEDLARKAESTAGRPATTQLGIQTIRNIASGQRFVTLPQCTQLDALLGGPLIRVMLSSEFREPGGG